MSETSSEKQMEDTTSLDEDSGHDSVDEISSERERIASLETAVNWIRDEVTQLKDYDRDILQELWRIRNTIHTIRDVHKRVRKEESQFLDETIEDRSPTPESQPEKIKEEQNQQKELEQDPKSLTESSKESLPPSPVQSPEFMSSEGEVYRSGTLQLMATAPQHLKQSSDDKLLEEFFGSDQVNKLGFFKSQTSLNNDECRDTVDSTERRVLQGVSMPNISSAPSSSPLTAKSRQLKKTYQQYESNQPVKKRLQIPKNPNADANRISYDVASEMEKLRARLQETAMQELAEFDRKYSPKLLHAANNVGTSEGRRSGEVSLNHSRQGSLDSSISSQPNSTTDLINHMKPAISQGHSRQHSLPIDPKYFRQLQRERSNNSTPPNVSPHSVRPAGVVIGRKVSSGHVPPMRNEKRSPSPPPFGHVRQVSGSSVNSENGAVSPPLVVRSGFQFPVDRGIEGDSRASGKQSKPPGMTRVPSNGSNPSHHHHNHHHSSGSVSAYNFNSNNRHSPEAHLMANPRSQSLSQTHYSSGALKRGKRNSGEMIAEPVGSYHQGHQYQQLYHSQPQSQMQHQQAAGSTKHLSKSQSYEDKVRAGFRPHTYEKPVVRGQGEAMSQDSTGRHLSHPRIDPSNISSSPKLARMPLAGRPGSAVTKRPSSAVTTRPGSAYSNGKAGGVASHPPSSLSDDIQPYMTSSQLKQQIFSYTPFSQQPQAQQRAYSMSSTAEPPRLQKKGGGGAGRSADQRTWI